MLFVESSKENLGTPYGQEILCDDYHNEEWKKHDAKLVASAPEMLRILVKVLDRIDVSDAWWMDCPDKGGFNRDEIKELIDKVL